MNSQTIGKREVAKKRANLLGKARKGNFSLVAERKLYGLKCGRCFKRSRDPFGSETI